METVIRAPFNVQERRENLVRRLTELRSLIPQMQEEKARIEGAILLLDELSAPPRVPGGAVGNLAENLTSESEKG